MVQFIEIIKELSYRRFIIVLQCPTLGPRHRIVLETLAIIAKELSKSVERNTGSEKQVFYLIGEITCMSPVSLAS